MAPSRFDHGTTGTSYSSIHSADAFVGDYQVMYTPGSTSPPFERAQKKSTRFSKATSFKSQNSQSIMLPNNIPNTSQILADRGPLPDVQIRYTLPADEKQIIASLRTLQRDLNEAMQTITTLTRQRDDALLELKLLKEVGSGRHASGKKNRAPVRAEEELFDLSRSVESPKQSPPRRGAQAKPVGKTTNSDDARILSPIPSRHPSALHPTKRAHTHEAKSEAKAVAGFNETENSILEDHTAASNTSRRRRQHALDDNMTSAYILPDITVEEPRNRDRVRVSHEAQDVLHRHDPEHLEKCDVCQRLTAKNAKVGKQSQRIAGDKGNLTAQITQFMKDAMLEEPTVRPKISPWIALANVKTLLTDQFQDAKRKHRQAWEKYDAIEAPMNSKKHLAASQDLFYWSKKMEECRINLDQLRDVEEGMRKQGSGS